MKTIANIIIMNSQTVKSEHLLAVIITSVFNEESLHAVFWSYVYLTHMHAAMYYGYSYECMLSSKSIPLAVCA